MSAISLVVINYAFVWIMHENVNIGGSIFNDIMALLIIEIIYFSQRYKLSVKRESLVKQENLKYKYEVLKAQINPHFLFNSLNILYSLIALDRQKSRDFVLSLSDIYRYVMSQENKNKIHINEELQFLESYISILRIRYDGCFNVEIHRSAEDTDMAMIIPFTLQLLIENAIKHNEISSKNSLTVNIDITPSYIIVSNFITPRKAESVSRIGLRYLSQLYALYNKRFYVEKRDNTFYAYVPYI
jgi:LytS/YehU family sensor histidine kinase